MKWVAVIPAGDAHQLAALRLLGGVEVCADGGAVWLRGPELDDPTDLALRKLSGARRFTVDDDGALVPAGARVPTHAMPEGLWAPLREYVAPASPTAALPANRPGSVLLRLVRGGCEQPANAIVTDMKTWLDYADGAPRVRLKQLTFAAASDGRVVIRGRPLPPIAGTLLVEHDGVAVPCGYRWAPAIDAAVVRQAVGLARGDLAILAAGGALEIVRETGFVAASRAAARLTAQELGHG